MGFRYPDVFTDNLEEMLLEGKGKEGKGVVRGGERREKRGEERMDKINRIAIQIGYLKLYCIFYYYFWTPSEKSKYLLST